jgi:hypothetical protein
VDYGVFFTNLYLLIIPSMEFLKSLSIRSKLFLISVIPSLGLIYLLQNAIVQSLERKETIRKVYENCEEVEKLSALSMNFRPNADWLCFT